MATTTTNFGWDIPQSTDLVKDGATAIAALGQDIDTALIDLKGGTTGQVLAKASNTDLDYSWVTPDDANAIQNAIIDAKGDLIVGASSDTPARLAVGTNDYVLTADSSATYGVKWAAISAAGGPAFSATMGSAQTVTANTWTKVAASTENFDTDACYDTGTYRFTPNKAGKYQINAYASAGGTDNYVAVRKNGTMYKYGRQQVSNTPAPSAFLVDMNGSTDYLELWVFTTSTTINGGATEVEFSGAWIRS